MTTTHISNSDFPLDDMQEAYFIGEQAGLPLSTRARYYRELEIDGFSAETVQAAWNTVVRRHDMLRAVILPSGMQRVLDDVEEYRIDCAELAGHSKKDRLRIRTEIRAAMLEISTPLDQWPQFAVRASRDAQSLRLHIRFNLWVIDAVSMQIILSELIRLCRNPAAVLPSPSTSFRNHIEARVAARNGPAVAAAQAYWRERAATLPAGPELPLKCSAEEVGTPSFSHLMATISADDWQDFRTRAGDNRVTAAFALVSAYALILARWSKRSHFTITTLMSRRPFAGAEAAAVVGNYGTTLLLEVDARTDMPFGEFAKRLQKQFWRDFKHISVSGIEVSREVSRLRQLPLGPLTPVTFTSSMTNDSLPEEGKEALSSIKHIGSHLDVPQVHLDYQVAEEPQGHLTVNWDAVEGLFHDGVVEEMFAGYVDLLRNLAKDAGAWTAASPVPLPAEQRRRLADYNETTMEYPDLRLEDLVSPHFTRQPGHVAVVNGEVSLNYGDLDARSGALAHALRNLYRAPNPLVAVMLPKGWEQIVAVLAIVRSGGAYVPIDPDLPILRRTQLLSQSGVAAILTSSAIAATADWTAHAAVVQIDTPPSAPDGTGTIDRSRLAPTDTAYVIFTSGSTGTPKGVAVDHRGAVNTILDINRRLDLGGTDKVLALSSLSFDLSVFDVFGTLAAGGTIIIPAAGEQMDPQAWCSLVNKFGVTVWNSVPALFQLVTDTAAQTPPGLPSLRAVMLSGDWIPRPLPEQGRKVAPAARIISLGGATEASIWSIFHEIGELDPAWKTIPYGRPLANQTFHVLDDCLRPCPLWTVGELYIGGVGVAQGYLHDDRRTAERFIIHPVTGDRLYRTGDLGRMRPCGNIEFLGREDHQIKIRGFRIELGEIEAAIIAQGNLSMAVVKVFGATDAGRRLVAFTIPKPDESADAEEIRLKLTQVLPRYMVPETIHVLDAPPLSSNGKIDHHALETIHSASTVQVGQVQVGQGQPGPGGASHAPEGDVVEEEIDAGIRGIWERVLGHGGIDPDASFFDLGGTSFQALQVIASIREKFGTRLTLNSFPSAPTVHRMAALIRKGAGNDLETPSILRFNKAPASAPASVFCVHPVGGSAHCYRSLAEEIGAETPVFGLQSSFPELAAEHSWSIEELADRYLKLILASAPDGAYALVGWSMGSAVAIEIARRLLALGKDLALVALIDPYRSASPQADGLSALELQLAFCRDLAGLAGIDVAPPPATEAQLAGLPDRDRFDALMRDLSRQGILPDDPPVDELHGVYRVFARNLAALVRYSPAAIDTDVTVFQAATPIDGTHLVSWNPVARSVDLHRMAFDHFTIMLPPAIDHIADIVNSRLGGFRRG